ncbi:MAG: hypothetical protein GWN22_12925, partial [Gemmatimonadetes bacterium]|nr:hypothetical protein [Gemmatimonadota bacterium]
MPSNVRRRFNATLVAAVALATAMVQPAAAQTLSAEQIRQLVATQTPDAFNTFREYLSLPNDGHFPEDIERLLAWLEVAFSDRGFTTQRLATPGNPLLFAERRV